MEQEVKSDTDQKMEDARNINDQLNTEPDTESKGFNNEPGTMYWTKIPKFPDWPSRMARKDEVGPPVLDLKHAGKPHLVYFFGSRDYLWVKENQMYAFDPSEARKAQRKKGQSKGFLEGLKEALNWFKTPEEEREYPNYEQKMKEYEAENPDDEDEEERDSSDEERERRKEKRVKKKSSKKKGVVPSVTTPLKKREKKVLTEEENKMATRRKIWRIQIMKRIGLHAPSIKDEIEDAIWYKRIREAYQAEVFNPRVRDTRDRTKSKFSAFEAPKKRKRGSKKNEWSDGESEDDKKEESESEEEKEEEKPVMKTSWSQRKKQVKSLTSDESKIEDGT